MIILYEINVCIYFNIYGNFFVGDIVIFMNCLGNKVFLIVILFNVFIGFIFVKIKCIFKYY